MKMKKCLKCVSAHVALTIKYGKVHLLMLFTDVIWKILDNVCDGDVKRMLISVEVSSFMLIGEMLFILFRRFDFIFGVGFGNISSGTVLLLEFFSIYYQ